MHGQEHSSKKEEYHEKHSQSWNAPLRIRIVGGNEELEYFFVEQDSQNASNETSAHSICHGFRKDHAPQLFLIHSERPHRTVLPDPRTHAHRKAIHDIKGRNEQDHPKKSKNAENKSLICTGCFPIPYILDRASLRHQLPDLFDRLF